METQGAREPAPAIPFSVTTNFAFAVKKFGLIVNKNQFMFFHSIH